MSGCQILRGNAEDAEQAGKQQLAQFLRQVQIEEGS
jgi:hypothetical protein